MKNNSSSSLFWTLSVGVVVAVGCATGGNPATEAVASDGGAVNGDGGCPCAANEVCVINVCELATTDHDGDGYPVTTDCDDDDPKTHPNAQEVCDDKDNNCNGVVDEGFDKDSDGYYLCTHGAKGIDCDDTNAAINPGATEICNFIDDNCNGEVDEGFDKDKDTFYECVHGSQGEDCNDNDPTVYPGAPEICDGKDNNCDGLIDNIPANVTTNDSFLPLNSHWVPVGATTINSAQEYAQLTPNTVGVAGALWWVTTNGEYTFDHFTMSAAFTIQNQTPQADGMGFAWIPIATDTADAGVDAGDQDAAPRVGDTGGGYGFVGLGGYGVVIDTYQNPGEPVPPFLAIVDGTSGAQLVRNVTPLAIVLGVSHVVQVTLVTSALAGDAGSISTVTVSVDSTVYINEFTIPGYVPFTGRWGFSGATGGFSEFQQVTDISMAFPDGQGCIK